MAIMSTPPISDSAVKAVRRFNRFFTRRIGVLDPYLASPLSLTEVRVLYELAHADDAEGLTATALGRTLGLDNGYLSRILKRFEAAGWLSRTPNPHDGRQSLLAITPAGRTAFEPLQQRARDDAAALLAPLSAGARVQVVQAMAQIESLFAEPGTARAAPATRTVILREPAPGDLGWVVQQHGEIYAREYGFNQEFEALVAEIAVQFVRRFDAAWEKGWIAELDGERVGAVFVVRKAPTVAQLRMLILAPQARGLGLGARLTDEAVAFARGKGYATMELWTNSCLTAARAIYARRGFVLDASEPYEGYGQQLVGESWSLKL
ncbi:MAG: GNAT family N-acetyltransferase [Comamonadaceae bacterium]|nr:MAG: GNAT family N-acetyltransferase [Comamonadaceae bacterium]